MPACHVRVQRYPFYSYDNPPALLYLQMCSYYCTASVILQFYLELSLVFDQNQYDFETYTSFIDLKIMPNNHKIENICLLTSGL